MGNQSSKPKGSNYPAFTRSDTSTSVRSSRSLRSRKSISRESQYSDAASFKTSHSNSEQQPNISRRNSGLNADFGSLTLHDHRDSQDVHSEAVLNDDELPPSMVQVAPKSPILKSERSSTSLQHLSIDPQTHQTPDTEYAQQELSQTLIIPQQLQQHRSNSNDFSIRSHSPSVSSRSNPSTPVSASFNLDPLDIPEQERPSLSRDHDIDLENTIQRLLDAGYAGKRTKNLCLKNSEVAVICSKAREIFLSQPSLLELSAPVKIVGDVHGQFSDLIRIFTKCGFPPASNYLFLGDYVDRGKQSLETILLLLCYKIKYPENFFLLRGNHECAQVTRAYGFFDECKRRTNLKTWKIFIDTFNTLPITAVVASKIFCVHGGLSPVLNSMDEIRRIKRPTDVPDYGLLNDLLWSDPADTSNEWEDNERGVSYCFNRVAINKFLNKFHFDLVVRAHMVVEDGYEFFNDRSLVTVFSAPNYCGEFDNWGAVMSVSEELLCSFELLDPLDSAALKKLMKQGKYERIAAGNRSSPSHLTGQSY